MRFSHRFACVVIAVWSATTAALLAQTVTPPTIQHVTIHDASGVLTIAGTGFGRDPVVTIDGQVVVVLQGASDTHLDVLAPAALFVVPGSYRVTVVDPSRQVGDVFIVATHEQMAPAADARTSKASEGSGIPQTTPDVGVLSTSVVKDMRGVAPTLLEDATKQNTALGVDALAANTTGRWNTAVGSQALWSNTDGWFNTAVGKNAMLMNTEGGNNVAVGREALGFNTTGSSNTAVGNWALHVATTGFQNTALGDAALAENTTGRSNTAGGAGALNGNTTGRQNTALGRASMSNTTTGSFNTAVGEGSLNQNTVGVSNVALGMNAGLTPTQGSWNIFLGASVTGGSGDVNTIRLGLPYNITTGAGQNQTFIAGIFGTQLSGDVRVVVIDQNGRLGTSAARASMPGVVPGQPGETLALQARSASSASTLERRELDTQRAAIANLQRHIERLEALVVALQRASSAGPAQTPAGARR